MKQESIILEELFDKNICLLKIATDYCSNNIDKAEEMSHLLTLLEVIYSNQKSIQSLFDTMELNNKNF